MTLTRRLAAEALGTGLLVAAVVGSGIMADRLTEDTALALLCNAVATGAALVVLITVFGPVSGAQFNPVVTLVFLLRREIGAGLATGYAAAQVAGGVAGTWVAHLMFGLPVMQLSQAARTGGSQWLAESVAAFGLVLAILGTIRAKGSVATVVGLYIVAAYWFTASTSFANPAVTLARGLTETFAGIRPGDVPGFVVAQVVGALMAAGLAGWLFAEGD
jgi:glycerol uptake facilitator-like aquaporin